MLFPEPLWSSVMPKLIHWRIHWWFQEVSWSKTTCSLSDNDMVPGMGEWVIQGQQTQRNTKWQQWKQPRANIYPLVSKKKRNETSFLFAKLSAKNLMYIGQQHDSEAQYVLTYLSRLNIQGWNLCLKQKNFEILMRWHCKRPFLEIIYRKRQNIFRGFRFFSFLFRNADIKPVRFQASSHLWNVDKNMEQKTATFIN